jgi:Superfamily II DNA/RNA helicases, SNF2 family
MLVRQGALLMSVDTPTSITVHIPTAKAIRYKNRNIVAVKHTLDSVRVLRNLGLNAPSPMLYDGFLFGGRYKPMDHQAKTAEFLTLHKKAFVFNTMGTGKTAACLWTMDYLRQRGYVKRVLIISPLSVMDVWVNEAFNVVPQWGTVQLVGKRERRIQLLHSGADTAIINFDGLVSIQQEVLDWNPDLIIVDEADAYCNPQTKRYKALRKTIKVDTRLWLLSGTPVANAPTDAYGLIKLVNPSSIGASFSLFRETLMRRAGPYKWIPKPDSEKRVYELMQPAIRFTKKDCLDLPSITFSSRRCIMSDAQQQVFDDMKVSMKHEDKDAGYEITAVNAAVKLIKLQQIMCGVVKDSNGDPVQLDPKNRLEEMEQLVAGSEGKVIIFVPFVNAMHLVLNYLSGKYGVALVNGSVKKAERDEIFRRFQSDVATKVLIAHPKVASHGLTLTAANTIIWYGPIFSVTQYTQANARIDRTGQTLAMSVYNLWCHPVELAIYTLLQSRESMQSRIMQLYGEALA